MSEPPSVMHDLARQRFGCSDIDAVFPRGAVKAVVPWPRAGRRKDQPHAFTITDEQLRAPVWLTEVDPRTLWASQGWVVREHATYYGTGAWERTGVTSADCGVESNRWPLVRIDHLGRPVILVGHHRSLAALIDGRPLLARVIPAEPDGAIAITPTLLLGTESRLPHAVCAGVGDAIDVVLGGGRALCADRTAVVAALVVLAPDFDAHRVPNQEDVHRAKV